MQLFGLGTGVTFLAQKLCHLLSPLLMHLEDQKIVSTSESGEVIPVLALKGWTLFLLRVSLCFCKCNAVPLVAP